ncbi:MAG: DUF2256 domain-containing protein [Betaproteobacteria bacterium]|nr:DUF2256 domain-containing protein [Betaproteobacteria bacterium]
MAPKPPKPATNHRGNKAFLPQKPCESCGLPMAWRKSWARNWDSVRYCSDRCRNEARRERRS